MAYTANLASFLIEENQKSVYLTGIDDANSNSLAVCGMAGQTSFLTLANYARIRQVHKHPLAVTTSSRLSCTLTGCVGSNPRCR